MPKELRPLPLQFWRSNSGREPTRDWFQELPAVDRAVLGHDMKPVQYGWPIGMPLVKSLGGGLWEVSFHCQASEKPALCLLLMKMALWFCMVSSRKPKKHRSRN